MTCSRESELPKSRAGPAELPRSRGASDARSGAGSLIAVLLLVAPGCVDWTPTSVPDSPAGSGSAAALSSTPAATGQPVPPFMPGRLLVRFQPGTDPAAVAGSAGAALERDLGLGIWLGSVPVGAELALAQALDRNPNVEFAHPDWIRTFDDHVCELCAVTGDEYMGYKWDLRNDGVITNSTGEFVTNTGAPGADLNWSPAFDALGTDFSGSAVVAILDTGIRGDHEELAGRVLAGYNFHSGNANWADDQGHGTHVAGIAGARGGNGAGVAGVAWGPNIRFLAVKVCGPILWTYGCTDSAISQGINWAAAQGANVLNLSLGGASSSSAVQLALQNALSQEALPVCAAGNDGKGVVSYPAAFPECVAVSSTNWSDGSASYTNWGPQIEVSAPGGDVEHASGYSYILSSYRSSTSSYAFMAGTSMAAPQVAGLAALLYSQGMWEASAVRAHLAATADDLGPAGWDSRFGHGRINVGRALAEMNGGEDPPHRPPVADFSYSCGALTCEFSDASHGLDGDVVGWAWTFGDGATSSEPNPAHTYDEPGTYSVSLAVTDDGGATGQTTRSVTLSDPAASMVADFTWDCDGLACQFVNLSEHPDGKSMLANWDLGDGSGMRITWEPHHEYAAPGSYEVILVVMAEDLSGWSSTRKLATVPEETAPEPDPDPDPEPDPNPDPDPDPEPDPDLDPEVTLTGRMYKVRGLNHVDLTWSGATTGSVAIFRDGSQIWIGSNDTSGDNGWTDAINSRGNPTHEYRICEVVGGTASEVCSPTVTVGA